MKKRNINSFTSNYTDSGQEPTSPNEKEVVKVPDMPIKTNNAGHLELKVDFEKRDKKSITPGVFTEILDLIDKQHNDKVNIDDTRVEEVNDGEINYDDSSFLEVEIKAVGHDSYHGHSYYNRYDSLFNDLCNE